MEKILISLLFLLACAYLINIFWQSFFRKESCAKGCAGGCQTKKIHKGTTQ